jgi:uncharacterized protein
MTHREGKNLNIENQPGAQRWEARLDQHLAVAEYRRRGETIFFIHTEVPPELEGQGVASQLVKTALDDARRQHLAVVPFCPFVAGYIQRHPDYQALVPADYRDLVESESSQPNESAGT